MSTRAVAQTAPPSPLARPKDFIGLEHKSVPLQRVDGRSCLTVNAGNRIGDLYQRTPCRILFPRSDLAESLEAVLLNTAGGLTGGDTIRQSIAVQHAASATVTSQAAEKIYRAADGVASVATDLTVDGDGRLEWLPQETIAFDGASLSRSTSLDLSDGAKVLALDWLVLGRKAHGESVNRGRIADCWQVRCNGRLVWADRFRLAGPLRAIVESPSQLDGSTALATLLYAGPEVENQRERVRAILDEFTGAGVIGGASLVDGVMLCRVLGRDGDALRPAIRSLVAELRRAFWRRRVGLPRVWNC